MNPTLSKLRRSKNRWRAAAILLLVACVGGFLWHYLNVWGFRSKLPWSARDVHEWHWEDGFLPDYDYMLKARITEADFRSYVGRLRLTPHTASRKYDEETSPWLDWKSANSAQLDWWNPSDSMEKTFVWQESNCWTFAKYEDGYVYLRSLQH